MEVDNSSQLAKMGVHIDNVIITNSEYEVRIFQKSVMVYYSYNIKKMLLNDMLYMCFCKECLTQV